MKKLKYIISTFLLFSCFFITSCEYTNDDLTSTDFFDTGAYLTEYSTEQITADSDVITDNDASIVTDAFAETSDDIKEDLPKDSSFSVKFIDVGQADSALVECDGHYMLIDGGNKGDSSLIYSVLKNSDISHLDIVVATHAHEDHIGGLPGAFSYAHSDITLCPVTSYESDAFDDLLKSANKKGGGITVPSVGDTYYLGSAVVTILGVNSGSETNDTSIVLKIQYGDTSFLFTGDAERTAEQVILNSGCDLSSTVLKVGHHGSDTSTTYPFLREIMPQYAVISVGDNNSYGLPSDDTLSRLNDADVTVYRTDLHGDIVFASDGKSVTVSTDRSTSEDTTDTDIVTETVKADYVINKNTGKFHLPSCSSVKNMSEKNKLFHTGTRDELITSGYSPCGNCNP